MSKSISVLPPHRRRDLDASFQEEVRSLATEGADLVKSHSDLTMRMLKFAQHYRKISHKARRLDGDESNSAHVDYLRAVLRDAVQSENKTIASQWNTIGEHATQLLTYRAALPPQRDSLYEMALAVGDNRPIQKWIKNGKLTSVSTVRDVKALRKPKLRKKRGANKQYQATVTLRFSTYAEAATALKEVFKSRSDFTVQSNDGFRDAMKEKLGRNEYEKQEKRFA